MEIAECPDCVKILFSLESHQFSENKCFLAQKKFLSMINFLHVARSNTEPLVKQIEDLWNLLFIKERFCHTLRDFSSRFTLCGTLNNRAGTCLGLSTLFFSLAISFGIPIRPLLMEGHFATVFMEGDGIVIDPSRSLYGFYSVPLDLKNIEPFKILADEEFIAVHLANRACFVYANLNLMDDAIYLIDSALEIFPDYTAGWINRAVIMKQIDNVKEMRHSLDMAKSLNPGVRYIKAIERIENNNLTTN
jgi:tetratricopeptide (TPR) repeat protein